MLRFESFVFFCDYFDTCQNTVSPHNIEKQEDRVTKSDKVHARPCRLICERRYPIINIGFRKEASGSRHSACFLLKVLLSVVTKGSRIAPIGNPEHKPSRKTGRDMAIPVLSEKILCLPENNPGILYRIQNFDKISAEAEEAH